MLSPDTGVGVPMKRSGLPMFYTMDYDIWHGAGNEETKDKAKETNVSSQTAI